MAGGIVTLLFSDVVDSTGQLGRLGDEQADVARRAHFRDLREAVTRSGGEEVKTMGDGIMAVFASAVDALHASVAIQRAAAGATVRVGLHVGEPIQDEDDYFGTPVVVARRLCDAAGGGQVLVSDLVRALVASRGIFAFHDAGYVALKGLPEPVAAWELDWKPTVAAGESVPLPAQLAVGERLPFVGRGSLVDQLWINWKKAQSGHRALVMLAGEPGIGKTRLAAQFAQLVHDDGATVLFGHADEETLLPYQPFVEALQHLVRTVDLEALHALVGDSGSELARLLPALRERIPVLPEPMRSEPESERFRLFETIIELLSAAAAESPVVVVLDDLHWADRPTLVLLHHIFCAPAEFGLLVVGTYRDTDLDRRHPLATTLADLRRLVQFERIGVGGLEERDLAGFLDLVTGQAPSPEFARALHDQTEGNPFFIGEVLRHLVESGLVSLTDGEWVTAENLGRVGIPEGVKEVIGRRLTRLSDDVNVALAVAAVSGRDFDFDVVERVSDLGEDRLLVALDDAVTARLVSELPGYTSRFRFAHALVRETLYDELTTARRVRTHRRIAQAIEETHGQDPEPPLEQLAYHWFEAAQAGDVDKAVDYARRAGRRALGQLAWEEAAVQLGRALGALELTDRPDAAVRCDVLIELGEARANSGDRVESRQAYEEARVLSRTLDDGQRLARAALGWVGHFLPGEARAEEIAVLEEALARQPEGDSEMRANLLSRLTAELTFADDRERFTRLGNEAMEMARRLGDPAVLARALIDCFYAIYDRFDQVDVRLAIATEALGLGRAVGDADIICAARERRVVTLVQIGDMTTFDAEVEAHDVFTARLRMPGLRWFVLLWRGTRALMAGHLLEAERLAVEAMTLGQQADDPVSLQMVGAQLFELRREQGRLDELEGAIRAMTDQFPTVPAWRGALALLLAETDRSEEAIAQLDLLAHAGLAAIRVDWNWPVCMAAVVDACYLLGRTDMAAEAYDQLLPFEHRFISAGVAAGALGSVARLLGETAALCGRHDDAVRHMEIGVVADETTGGTRYAVRGQWALARTLLARDALGDRARAAGLAQEALVIAEGLDLIVLAERLRGIDES